MPSEHITISRSVLNELIQSGQQALGALRGRAQHGRLARALQAAKSERARANSATAKANRRARAAAGAARR